VGESVEPCLPLLGAVNIHRQLRWAKQSSGRLLEVEVKASRVREVSK
jgi:hypothetical protein